MIIWRQYILFQVFSCNFTTRGIINNTPITVMIHLVFRIFKWFWIMRWIMPSLTCLFHCLYLCNPHNNFYMRGKIFCPLMEKMFTFFVTDFIDILNLLLVDSYNFRINFFDLFSFLWQNGTSFKVKGFWSCVKFEHVGERGYQFRVVCISGMSLFCFVSKFRVAGKVMWLPSWWYQITFDMVQWHLQECLNMFL